jgi:hypothetical protein
MQEIDGSAIVSIASSRRPADWPRTQETHFSVPHRKGGNAFGGTPKAAGEDAPRSPIQLHGYGLTRGSIIWFWKPVGSDGRLWAMAPPPGE